METATITYKIKSIQTAEQPVTLPFYYKEEDPFLPGFGRIYHNGKEIRHQHIVRSSGGSFIYSETALTSIDKEPIPISQDEYMREFDAFITHLTEQADMMEKEAGRGSLTEADLQYIQGQ